MDLKWYQGSVMPLYYYSGMDDRNNSNQLHTISPSVLPASHGTPLPPASPDHSMMLPPQTPLSHGKEHDENQVGGHLMDRISTSTETEAGMIPPEPTKKEASMIPSSHAITQASMISPVPMVSEAGMILPPPTEKDPCTLPPTAMGKGACTIPPTVYQATVTPAMPTDHKLKGSPKANLPATPGCESNSSDDDPEDAEYVSCLLELLGLNLDCKRMLHDQTKMFAHNKTIVGNNAIPIVQQAENEDPEVYKEVRAQLTAALVELHEAIAGFVTQLGNILHYASSEGARKSHIDGGRRKQVRKEW